MLMTVQTREDVARVANYLLRLAIDIAPSDQRDEVMKTMSELLVIDYQIRTYAYADNAPILTTKLITKANKFLRKLDKSGIITFLELTKGKNNG